MITLRRLRNLERVTTINAFAFVSHQNREIFYIHENKKSRSHFMMHTHTQQHTSLSKSYFAFFITRCIFSCLDGFLNNLIRNHDLHHGRAHIKILRLNHIWEKTF